MSTDVCGGFSSLNSLNMGYLKFLEKTTAVEAQGLPSFSLIPHCLSCPVLDDNLLQTHQSELQEVLQGIKFIYSLFLP